MIVLLVLAIACAAAAARLALAELAARGAGGALARAASYGGAVVDEAPAAESAARGELLDRIGPALFRILPGRERGRTLAQLQAAGFASVRPEAFLALQAGSTLAGLLVGVVLGASAGPLAALLLGLLFALVAFVAPDLVLRRRAGSRRERILGELPNALDLLAVIVEAGLGFDAALVRYSDTAEGALAEEVRLLATELRVGSRADAFKRLAERVDAPELRAFVRSVVHADQLGTSLSRTLRTQAADVRRRRQSSAEERANKLPVKMLFPTVFCIFPALFLVVVGPPFITILRSF